MIGQLIRLCAVAAVGAGFVFLIQQSRADNTAESLAADLERLREVQRLCSEDWAGTGDALCTAASQARRKRFTGSGGPRYTPRPVELFPSLDEDGKLKPDEVEPSDSIMPAKPDAE